MMPRPSLLINQRGAPWTTKPTQRWMDGAVILAEANLPPGQTRGAGVAMQCRRVTCFRPRPWPGPVQSQDVHRVSEMNSFRLCMCECVCGQKTFTRFVLFAHKMHTRRRFLHLCHSPSFSSNIVASLQLYLPSTPTNALACSLPSTPHFHPSPCISSLGHSTGLNHTERLICLCTYRLVDKQKIYN